MSAYTRRAAAALVTAGIAAFAVAQTPPSSPPPTAPAASPPVAPPMQPPVPAPVPEVRPEGTAATVNGQAIPEVNVYRALRQIPEADRAAARKDVLDSLIENVIIDQYLTALKITPEAAQVEKVLGEIKEELKKAQKDYEAELKLMMLTDAEFRAVIGEQMKWDKFVEQQGTDAALKKLYDAGPNVFDGTLVRARHVLLNPGADPAKVTEAKQTLAGIKATVEAEAKKAEDATQGDAAAKLKAKNIRAEELFGEYAKKYSACPSKKEGGDINYFPRVGAMVEPFAAAAFALNPFGMTDVVQTEFGYHVIMVTDRKPGTLKPFEGVKNEVRMLYAVRLREAVLGQMKPKAQIAITPK